MIRKTISHYEILEKLGEGGMGVVYKALDTKLNRHVAIKFLPRHLQTNPEAKQRFVHEARAASALEHPNICSIHEINETPDQQMYMVMPSYDGQSLQDRLEVGSISVKDVLGFVEQIASGLAKAHAKGIVHRDIKPSNIFLTEDGYVIILDFGLAKLAGQTKITKTGSTVGTVSYMSPEQAQGGEIGERSDVFSLGVVLYQMFTGHLPFFAEQEAAVLYKIMNEDPAPLATYRDDLPEGFQRVVDKLLAKDPGQRYEDASALLKDLELLRLNRSVAPLKRKAQKYILPRRLFLTLMALLILIASYALVVRLVPHRTPTGRPDGALTVLIVPFEMRGQGEGSEYAGKAFAEALAVNLAQLQSLRILPVPTTEEIGVRGKIDLAPAALKIGAHRVMTGALTRVVETVKVHVNLIDAAENAIVWGMEESSETGDLAMLANRIADEVVRAVSGDAPNLYEYFRYVTGSERMMEWPLLAETVVALRNYEVAKGLELTERLVDEYPDEPDALIMRLTALVDADWMNRTPQNRAALRDGLKALAEVDAANPHLDIIEAYLLYGQQTERSVEILSRVLERTDMKPTLRGYALRMRSQAYGILGESEPQVADLEESRRIDPASQWSYCILATFFKDNNEYERSAELARMGWAVSPYNVTCWYTLGASLAMVGRADEATDVFERGCKMLNSQLAYSQYALAMAEAGLKENAREVAERARTLEPTAMSAVTLADACARVSEDEMAVDFLKQGLELGYDPNRLSRISALVPLLDRPELRKWK